MDYEQKYKDALEKARQGKSIEEIFPELTESEDERIREDIIKYLQYSIAFDKSFLDERYTWSQKDCSKWLAWLKKQGEQKEINLVEILKHYPSETELYSPLYGKLWLAEVDEEHDIITCYKRHLSEGCKRAMLWQENTVSFYSNGTTGLPDCSVSKDCMLFLYNDEKQDEKKTTWSEEDEENRINAIKYLELFDAQGIHGDVAIPCINWLKSIKYKV